MGDTVVRGRLGACVYCPYVLGAVRWAHSPISEGTQAVVHRVTRSQPSTARERQDRGSVGPHREGRPQRGGAAGERSLSGSLWAKENGSKPSPALAPVAREGVGAGPVPSQGPSPDVSRVTPEEVEGAAAAPKPWVGAGRPVPGLALPACGPLPAGLGQVLGPQPDGEHPVR